MREKKRRNRLPALSCLHKMLPSEVSLSHQFMRERRISVIWQCGDVCCIRNGFQLIEPAGGGSSQLLPQTYCPSFEVIMRLVAKRLLNDTINGQQFVNS